MQGAASTAPFYECPFCKYTMRQEVPLPAPPPIIVTITQPSAAVRASRSGRGGGASILAILPVLLPFAIVGTVLAVQFRQPLMNLTGIGAWDGDAPLVCDGNDDIDVSGVTAHFSQGSAIVAGGNCHVKLRDCAIKAGTAIEASGNAHVTVVNGSLEGSSAAVDARNNATVDLLGNVKTTGSLRRTSNARVTGK